MNQMGVCLWFDDQAEAAAKFYVDVFANSRVIETTHYLANMPGPEGTVLTVRCMLDGLEVTLLNGGPVYQITPAVSLIVTCETQDEIDRLWERLTEGGEEVQCGWLTDRFGVSWQIVPAELDAMFNAPDRAAAQRAAEAMLKMIKLDIEALREAFRGA